MPCTSTYLVTESTKRLPGPPDPLLLALSICLLWLERTGDSNSSFLSLLFCFALVLWDRVSCYLGGLKSLQSWSWPWFLTLQPCCLSSGIIGMYQHVQVQRALPPRACVCIQGYMCSGDQRSTENVFLNQSPIHLLRQALMLLLELTKLARLAG